MLAADLISMTQAALRSAQSELYTMEEKRKKARRHRMICKIVIILAAIAWPVLNVAIFMFIWKCDAIKESNGLDLYKLLIATVSSALPFIFACVTNKEVNMRKAIIKFPDKVYEKKCKKLSCTDTIFEEKKLEIEGLKNRLHDSSQNTTAA